MTAYKPTTVAENEDHLRQLVEQAIDALGGAANLNHIDVSRVSNFDSVFSSVPFQGDISHWDVSNATSMVEFFYNCPFKGDISHWNTSRVVSMANMFEHSSFAGDISQWDTRSVVNFDGLFLDSPFAGDISHWSFQDGCSMFKMFSDAQLHRLVQPNIYVWCCAIMFPSEKLIARPWLDHANGLRPTITALQLPMHAAARMVHNAWTMPHLEHEMWSLPDLN